MNLSKPAPHTTSPDTIISSVYDETEPQRRIKKARIISHPRATHKHLYQDGWYCHHFVSRISGNTLDCWVRIRYCTICGRIQESIIAHNGQTPSIGSTVFPEPSGNSVDLNNSYVIKENVL